MARTKKTKPKEEVKEVAEYVQELCALNEYISQYGSGASLTDISLKDLFEMLRNPYKNIKKIQTTSKYFSNRYGVVKDVNEMFRNLLTLNFHLAWSNFDNPQKIKKYERKIYDLIDTLDIKKVIRDGLSEESEMGTVVTVNRGNKYIQFLDLENLRINKQVNGKWVVEVDLNTIKGRATSDTLAIIESLPEEITLNKYNAFKRDGKDENRYIEIKNAWVHNIRGNRNFPYGLPYSLPAWGSLIHKTLIEQVEKSVADRLIKAVLILYAKSVAPDKEAYKPPAKTVVQSYFNELTKLIQKTDSGKVSGSSDSAGTGVMTLPDFFKLEQVKIDTNIFPKELYEKIQNNILSDLGVSGALIYGSGAETNFGAAQMNSEKFFKHLFSALHSWEQMINEIIQSVLPNDLDCKFFFDKTTIFDREKDVDAKKEFYMQTGIWMPWAEAVLGVPYHYALGMKQYQDKVLQIEDIIRPPQNAYTQPGDNKGGRPENDLTDDSDSNVKAKSNGANNNPSPSDK